MSLQSRRTTGNGTKPSLGELIVRGRSPLVILALMISFLFVTSLGAVTVLDPQPEPSSTLFGRSVAVVGDIDGDRVPDLAVGAPFHDSAFEGAPGFGPPQNVGRVFLISGATLRLIRELNDPEFQMINLLKFGGQLGTSVADAGDINGDGVPDVIAGDPHHVAEPEAAAAPSQEEEEERIISAGRTFVFSGSNGNVLLTLDDPTPEENARAGYAVAGLDDVNSDGVRDILVGVPGKDTGVGADVGVAYIYSGADGSLIRTLKHPGNTAAARDARFGFAVANAGDIDKDHVSDILIGAPGQGRAFVFSGATGGLIFTIRSPVAERNQPSFGFAVAGGRDLNGDGTADFVVGAPLRNALRGEVFVFNGKNGNLLRSLVSPTPEKFSRFGSSLLLTKDVSGDGRPDIWVGAPDQNVNGLIDAGEVFVFNGPNGNLVKSMTSDEPQAFAGYGSALAAADFDGNRVPDPVVGTPFQNADLIDPNDGDVVTHLQIGQIELQ